MSDGTGVSAIVGSTGQGGDNVGLGLPASPVALASAPADLFIWKREPRQEWQSALDKIAPPAEFDNKARAVIWWEPGDEWEPIQRWMIYQVLPRKAIPPDILLQLMGNHPRSKGRYSQRMRCWVDGPAPSITRTAWEIFRVTGGWAKAYWVVQGPNGGHRFKLQRWEGVLSMLHGGKPDTPAPGDLPYAEPDERTFQKLREAAKWSEAALGAAMLSTKHRGAVSAEEWAQIETAAKGVLEWFGTATDKHADELKWALARDTGVARLGPGEKPKENYERDAEEFLHDIRHTIAGTVPGM